MHGTSGSGSGEWERSLPTGRQSGGQRRLILGDGGLVGRHRSARRSRRVARAACSRWDSWWASSWWSSGWSWWSSRCSSSRASSVRAPCPEWSRTSFRAWARSAAACCWSVVVWASSWVSVLWSWVIVLWLPVPSGVVPSCDDGTRRRGRRGRRTASRSSRPTDCSRPASASPRRRSPWTEPMTRTRSARSCRACRATGPAVTCCADGRRHGGHLAGHLERGRGIVDGLDGPDHGEALPDVGPGDAGRAVARVPAPDLGPGGGPAAEHDDEDDHARRRGRADGPNRLQPLPVELGTATAGTSRPPPPRKNPPPPKREAAGARLATGRGDADGRGCDGAVRRGRTERTHAITDGEVGVAAALWVAATVVDADGRDLEVLRLGRGRLLCLRCGGFGRVQSTAAVPGERSTPETETVVPLTAVTLPVAMAIDREAAESPVGSIPTRKRRAGAAGAAEAASAEAEATAAGTVLAPPRPAARPELPRARPVEDGGRPPRCSGPRWWSSTTSKAVPVTVTQSPTVREITVSSQTSRTASSTSSSPWSGRMLAFCTSMVEPEIAATLPMAPSGAFAGVVAAPTATRLPSPSPAPVAVPAAIGASAGEWCVGCVGESPFRTFLCFLSIRFVERRWVRGGPPGWPGRRRRRCRWPERQPARRPWRSG